MSMRAYRLRQQLQEAIDSENWTGFTKLWRELISTDWSYRFGSGKRSHSLEASDRFISFLTGGYPTYLTHIFPGDQDLSVLRHFSCLQLDDSDGRLCFRIQIGHGILTDIQITGPVVECDLTDLIDIYRKGTLTCNPQVLACLYPPALSLLLKVSPDVEDHDHTFLGAALNTIREAYVMAVTPAEQPINDRLENLIAVLPDIGKMPAIAALQAGNARAARRLFGLLSRLHYFEAYDYSNVAMQDHRMLDLSRKLSLSCEHNHQVFIAGQCIALSRLMMPAPYEKLDLARLAMVTRLLTEELLAHGGDWVCCDWFVPYINEPLYTVRNIVMWHHCRRNGLYVQEPRLDNPLRFESYIAMFNLLQPYVEAVSALLCSFDKSGYLSVVLNTLGEICKHASEMQFLEGEFLTVFEESRRRLEEKQQTLEGGATQKPDEQEKAQASPFIQESRICPSAPNLVTKPVDTPKDNFDELAKPDTAFTDLAKWVRENEDMTLQKLQAIDSSAQQRQRLMRFADEITDFIDETGQDTPAAQELREYTKRMVNGENLSPDEVRNFWLKSRLATEVEATAENLDKLLNTKGVKMTKQNGKVSVENL